MSVLDHLGGAGSFDARSLWDNMSLTNKFGLVAGTTALAIAGSAFGGVESDNDALSQIAELKQELAELKQQNGQDWLTEQRSSEIRGIVQDVLADADTRTSLQSSGAMAGYNNGFFLASPDGSDLSIIRIAHANGRRPHYVVYDGTRDRLDAPDAPHPTSEAGRRLRSRRLAAATRKPAFVVSRRREIQTERGTEVETLEVQVTDDVATA